MMQGSVSFGREAILSITMYDAQGVEREIECVIDTGFTSYLTMPQSIIDTFGLTLAGTVQVELADASVVRMAYCDVEVLWHNGPRTVRVYAAEGKPLLGMSLLYGSRMEMNVVDGGAFTIYALM